MKLLLTGATGFVGFNLLLEALRVGRYEEIVVPIRDAGKLQRLLEIEGFSDAPQALRIMDWNDSPPAALDHAVHCAGALFARDRATCFRVNVEDTLRLLRPLSPSARVLVLSSQSAGGPTPAGKSMRTSEDPDTPLTWYGESKLAMERRLVAERPEVLLWRPPMILGPRDRATLPLFQMASGRIRIKPGLEAKTYSWIAVGDLVGAIFRALDDPGIQPCTPMPVCAPDSITDERLIRAVGDVIDRKGWTLPLPHLLIRGVAAVVDALPALRTAAPSLTRDRVREIFANRWVIDGSEFRSRYAPGPFASLEDTLSETCRWYERAGLFSTA